LISEQNQVQTMGGDNNEVWSKGRYVRDYASRWLRPPEVNLLLRYAETLSGRVLEIGCGAGRITGYLGARGGDVLGVDISPAMVEYCEQLYPELSFAVMDLNDLRDLEDGSRELIVAEYNVLGVLDHAERQRVLVELRRILSDNGILLFSAHNHAFLPKIARPSQLVTRSKSPARSLWNLARLPQRMVNHRRLRPFERFEPDYAIVNDEAHDFRLLHYYISRKAQETQLDEAGFDLLECLDADGRAVLAGNTADEHSELHYAARRRLAPRESHVGD
jgi:SAM-dependent methyltransferase